MVRGIMYYGVDVWCTGVWFEGCGNHHIFCKLLQH